MDFRRNTIDRRVMTDLRKRSTTGIVFYLILLVAVMGTESFYERHMTFSIWFSVSVTAICLFRFLYVMSVKKLEKISEKLSDAIFFGSVVLTALIWGIGFAIFLWLPEVFKSKLLISICTAGLCAGGVSAFLPERRLSAAYSICMLFPAFVLLQIKGDDFFLSIIILLDSVYLVLIAFRGNREYWDALENEYFLKIKSDELEKLSNIDALTNVYNRRFFNEIYKIEWEHAIRNKHCLSVIICDIDHFKNINDTYGHLAGDKYLKNIADILKRVFQRKNDIVARYGGEEFVVLISDTDADNTCHLAERLRKEVKETHVIYKGEIVKTTISIGIMSCIPNCSANREAIMANADNALYQAKKEGRDRYCAHTYEQWNQTE